MTSFQLITDGTVRGITCGPRSSGLIVGRGSTGATIHLVPPPAMAFAPALWAEAIRHQLDIKSDGRIVIYGTREDPEADLTAIDTVIAEGTRGGITPGTYGSDIYTVAHCPDGWAYIVTCRPSGRASLKQIGAWTGTDNTFIVAFDNGAKLAAVLERVTTAKVKGETTTIALPPVPGLAVRIEGGEILIPWPGSDAEADILKAVPSLRWDKDRRLYAVSTRYSKRTAKALFDLLAARHTAAEAAATAAALIKDVLAQTTYGHLTVTLTGTTLIAAYRTYCDGAYKALSKLGRVEDRRLSLPITGTVATDAILAALRTADEALAATTQAARKAAADRQRQQDVADLRRSQRMQVRLDHAPKAGAPFRLPTSTIVICDSLGKSWTDRGTGHDYCYAYWREATPAEAEAFIEHEQAQPRTGTTTVRAEHAPAVGIAFRLPDGAAAVVTGQSRRHYIDSSDEMVTSSVSSDFWDCHVVDIDWREATANETATLVAKEAEAAARAAAMKAAATLRQRIAREGAMDELGHQPAGEILWENVASSAAGYTEHLILADDGRLWFVTYDGTDGGTWGTFNLGYNTRGRCITPTADDIALLRQAAPLTGFQPYRKA